MSLSYLNAIFGMETQKIQEMLTDVDINVYETLYAPFYRHSGEWYMQNSADADSYEAPILMCSYVLDDDFLNISDFSDVIA